MTSGMRSTNYLGRSSRSNAVTITTYGTIFVDFGIGGRRIDILSIKCKSFGFSACNLIGADNEI